MNAPLQDMSACAHALTAQIQRDGPMSVADFMAAASDAYYARGDVFGAAGDFTTAPEISQTFGEIIGAWIAVTWQNMGGAAPLRLVECGPGRGTLMADALRAASRVDGFSQAVQVHLVERSAALRSRQRATLGGRAVAWHAAVSEVPPGPMILVANEFLDALPIRQFEKTGDGWAERCVTLNAAGRFTFTLRPAPDAPVPPALAGRAPAGAIFETAPAVMTAVASIARRIAEGGGAALLIDYGYTVAGLGDSLQGVKAHRHHPVLETPGEADLTAHVNFAAVAETARHCGASVHGPIEHGAWLKRLGINARGATLATAASPDKARDILAGIERLTAPAAMGSLFKVIAITHRTLPVPDGFTDTHA